MDPCFLATVKSVEKVEVPDSSLWKEYQTKNSICRKFIPVPIVMGNVPVMATYDTRVIHFCKISEIKVSSLFPASLRILNIGFCALSFWIFGLRFFQDKKIASLL